MAAGLIKFFFGKFLVGNKIEYQLNKSFFFFGCNIASLLISANV